MNARGRAIAKRVTHTSGPDALRKALKVTKALHGKSDDETVKWIDSLSDEELADTASDLAFAHRGVGMLAQLFALSAMQRFEVGADDVREALREQQDLATVQEALAGNTTTTTQGA